MNITGKYLFHLVYNAQYLGRHHNAQCRTVIEHCYALMEGNISGGDQIHRWKGNIICYWKYFLFLLCPFSLTAINLSSVNLFPGLMAERKTMGTVANGETAETTVDL